MNNRYAQLRIDEPAGASVHDLRPELSQEELTEIRDILRVLRALRAFAKVVEVDDEAPVRLAPTPAPRPTDEQYARAVANVMKRMKGRG